MAILAVLIFKLRRRLRLLVLDGCSCVCNTVTKDVELSCGENPR